MSHRIAPILAGVAAALLILANCNRGDRIAPADATIDLAASPTTVVLVNGSGTSDIVATVSSTAGVPLPGQDVRFTNSAGSLVDGNGDPAANLPIRTDSYGNAHVILLTSKTTTVNARSGKATGSITLDTVTGDFNSIQLDYNFSDSGCIPNSIFDLCGGEHLCFIARALTASGDPVQGIGLLPRVQNVKPAGVNLSPSFSIQNNNAFTDSNGEVKFALALGNCSDCKSSDNNSCSGEVVVTLLAGGFPSNTQTFTVQVP